MEFIKQTDPHNRRNRVRTSLLSTNPFCHASLAFLIGTKARLQATVSTAEKVQPVIEKFQPVTKKYFFFTGWSFIVTG